MVYCTTKVNGFIVTLDNVKPGADLDGTMRIHDPTRLIGITVDEEGPKKRDQYSVNVSRGVIRNRIFRLVPFPYAHHVSVEPGVEMNVIMDVSKTVEWLTIVMTRDWTVHRSSHHAIVSIAKQDPPETLAVVTVALSNLDEPHVWLNDMWSNGVGIMEDGPAETSAIELIKRNVEWAKKQGGQGLVEGMHDLALDRNHA